MNVIICDVCGNVVHGKRYVVIVVPVSTEDTKEQMLEDPRSYFQQREDKRKEVEKGTKEMCEGCKELHDRLFKLRKEKVKKLKGASDDVLKKFLKGNI